MLGERVDHPTTEIRKGPCATFKSLLVPAIDGLQPECNGGRVCDVHPIAIDLLYQGTSGGFFICQNLATLKSQNSALRPNLGLRQLGRPSPSLDIWTLADPGFILGLSNLGLW